MRLALVALIACLAMPAFADDAVQVTDAYAVVTTPTSPTAAVYFVMANAAAQDDRLIAVATDAAQKTMLHASMESADGVMTMAGVDDGFVVQAGGTFVLERGANHVMLMGLTTPLDVGDTITLTLTFEHAGDVVVQVPVNPAVIPGQ